MKPSRPKTPRKQAGKLKSAKDPIEVYCRIRPHDDNEEENVCIRAVDDKTVALFNPDVAHNSRAREVHYSFKRVFDGTTSQKDLFDNVCLPLVQDVLQGSNGLLFTYGISSSGKTYTMTGTPQDGGLLPRSLDVIFNSIKDVQAKKYVFIPDPQENNCFKVQSPADALTEQQKELGIFCRSKPKNKRDMMGDFCSRVPDSTVVSDILVDMCFSVFVSYVEIYNNYINDLLDETPKLKMLREDKSKNVYVSGVQENEVKTVEEALEFYYKGQTRRNIAQTALNRESSRSHCVFTIRIVQAPLDPIGAEVLQDKDKLTVSQLSLVDLAGSERSKRTGAKGYKLKEAGNINVSLSTLKNCIEILRESQARGISKVVPYRESKITYLFKTFFEGEGKLRMIVCINPHADNYEETIHVLKFAELTQDVEIARATPVSTPITPGLRAGRGIIYREAIKKAKEQGVPISEILLPTVYNLGPEFPPLTFEAFDDESSYITLIEFLSSRIAKKNSLSGDLDQRQEEFRKKLLATDKEVLQLKQEKQILQMDLEAREQQIRSLEQKLCSVEESIDLMQRHVDDYKRKAENASTEVYNKEKMLVEKMKEIERMKKRNQEKLASTKEHMKRVMDQKLAEAKRKMCLTADGVRQLREIINNDEWDEYLADANNLPRACVPSTTDSESSVPVTRRKRSSSEMGELAAEARFIKAKSGTDVHNSNSASVPISSQPSRNAVGIDSVFYKENRPPATASNSRGVVVSNPRHRRSTSTGDMWIEHKPIGNLELNTVLQPAMKKKKSVSKLEVKDVTNSEKYVLQHQEQDSQGEVETQLFKADIIPSAGGGAQVVFNDVEKLRQVSPPPVYNLRKRSGDLPLREIESRCTVSVECHGLPSKILKK